MTALLLPISLATMRSGMLGRDLLDALADFVAAGEQHDVDVGIAHQRLAGFAVAVDQVDDARRKARFLEQLDEALADGRRVLRRLEDDRVAFDAGSARASTAARRTGSSTA